MIIIIDHISLVFLFISLAHFLFSDETFARLFYFLLDSLSYNVTFFLFIIYLFLFMLFCFLWVFLWDWSLNLGFLCLQSKCYTTLVTAKVQLFSFTLCGDRFMWFFSSVSLTKLPVLYPKIKYILHIFKELHIFLEISF
jgi:hypothetical protein